MITILSASSGNNLKLAGQFKDALQSEGVDCEIINIVDLELPLYVKKSEKSECPEGLKEITEKLSRSEGLIFTSPEYNGGIPPVLTNLIAWVSRSGDNWREAFNEKPAIIATHSGGGGANILFALRNQLAFLGMNVIGRQIIVNKSKTLNPDSLKSLAKLLKSLIS